MGPLTTMFGAGRDSEARFQEWYAPIAQMMGMDPNPYAPEHHYDMRAFHDAGGQGATRGHFPSKYKTEGHPRTFLDDTTGRVFDTRTARYLDGSPVSPRLLRASESSPDMPFYGPEER